MVGKASKGQLTEDDISCIIKRYGAETVIAMLREMAQVADGGKFDWVALVDNSSTGISTPREYQMLWRHLAYGHALDHHISQPLPLDDNSDLEYEVEAFPAVNSESAKEAAAYIKVMIASGLPSDSTLPNGLTVEAPLTINVPTVQPTRSTIENSHEASFLQGTNITIPVSVRKQPLPTVTAAEGADANGSAKGSLPARRKRKPWSEEEDMALVAAVKNCGEGNWANILKGDFKGYRTTTQLSQRWETIKKQGNSSAGDGSQLSKAQLAARQALALALRSPKDKKTCSFVRYG